MIEIAPHLFYIPGKNHSRFPYCACLYVKGGSFRVLIDAGMGSEGMAQVKEAGLDVLILTHSHVDHHLSRRLAAEAPVWCHLDEKPYFQNMDFYFRCTGLADSGIEIGSLLAAKYDLFDFDISRTLTDGEEIDLGGVTLITFHTPGHTPGHMSFYIPRYEILFSADVDLTPFGPFYGHYFADLEDFLKSIDRLEKLPFKTVVTGHAGPFDRAEAMGKFKTYKAVVWEREDRVLSFLDQPRRIEDFRGSRVIYPRYPEDLGLSQWFELVHVKKHLERLAAQGAVREEDGMWVKG